MTKELKQTTLLKILLPVKQIPHGSRITKRTGEAEYTLVNNLKVYQTDGKTPLVVQGYFLISDHNINQIESDKLVHWHTSFYELSYIMRYDRDDTEEDAVEDDYVQA